MRNIGKSDAKFQLSVQEPFFVTPDSGRLDIGESMQIHVDFKALQTGDHASHMILQYETGMTEFYIFMLFKVVSNLRLIKPKLLAESVVYKQTALF